METDTGYKIDTGPKMKIVTFTGTDADALHKMTIEVQNANLVLINSRVDYAITGLAYAAIPRVLNLQIGNTVSNDFVIDNDDTSNYYSYSNKCNPVTVDGVLYNISQYEPVGGYKMAGNIERQTRFVIRGGKDQTFNPALLTHFFFQFQVV